MSSKQSQAKTGKDVIKAMIWLYENRLAWTPDCAYRDHSGTPIMYADDSVASASLYGCINLVNATKKAKHDAANMLYKTSCNWNNSFTNWNDIHNHTKHDVVSFLTKAMRNV